MSPVAADRNTRSAGEQVVFTRSRSHLGQTVVRRDVQGLVKPQKLKGSLQIDLHAEFDDAAGRQTEVGGCGAGVARDEREERFTPTHHLAFAARQKSFSTEVVAGAARVDGETKSFASEQRIGDVGRLHEAVTNADAVKPLALIFDGEAFVGGNFGHVFARHAEQHDLFVEHLVVLEVMQQDGRGAVGIRGHEYGCSADAMRRRVPHVVEEILQGQDIGHESFAKDLSAALPRGHGGENNAGNEQREPTAVGDFGNVSSEKRDVDCQEDRDWRQRFPHRPTPTLRGNDEVHDGRDRHRDRDGDAVGRGKRSGGLEGKNQPDTSHEKRVVDLGDVDLSFRIFRRVNDGHTREVTKLYGLLGE
jgi:hypothetical protein